MSSASTHTEKRRASGCRQTTTTTPPPPSLPKKRTKKKKRDVIVRDHIDPYYIHVFSLQRFFQSSDDALYSRASRVCFTKRFSLTLSSLSLFFSVSFFFLFYDVQTTTTTTTTTTAYFNAETGTTNWEEMWRQEDGEETQPKFDCRRTGESIIIILASFFLSRGKNTRRLYYYHRSFVFTRGGGQKSRSSRSM